jgi:hypothetical protein
MITIAKKSIIAQASTGKSCKNNTFMALVAVKDSLMTPNEVFRGALSVGHRFHAKKLDWERSRNWLDL